MQRIHKIRMGLSNAYLIQDEEDCILVDAGHPNHLRLFSKHLRRWSIDPSQIKLVVITHVHFDHVGSLAEIKRLCRCPVAIHEEEAAQLTKGTMILPPGTNFLGKAASHLGSKLASSFITFQPVHADIIYHTPVDLDAYGISGRIIPTGGHTAGSSSVLLSTGEAFVGDLAANYLPFGLGPILPPFAANVPELLMSWQALLDAGAKKLYPAHGSPFHARLLRQKLSSESREYGLTVP